MTTENFTFTLFNGKFPNKKKLLLFLPAPVSLRRTGYNYSEEKNYCPLFKFKERANLTDNTMFNMTLIDLSLISKN